MLLVGDEPDVLRGERLVERLAASSPRIRWRWAPPVVDEPWFPVAQKLRHALDYVRFLEPRFDGSPKLHLRTVEKAPRIVRWLGQVPGLRRTPLRRALAAVLMQLERLMPVSEASLAFLREERPDVLLLTSMTYARAPQLDHQKAARRLGIPVGACIMSWDHLSSKSLLHLTPDRVFLWNPVQRQEAVDMHPLPAERIVVTGAQCYDQWFDKGVHKTREEFCRALGFDPSKDVIMYVASAMSPYPDPPEPAFVRQWLEALRASDDPRLREASVLIRPHPERTKEWRDFDAAGLGPAVVHGRNPIDADAKTEYFDSLFHSAAVVGICTTVFIEAAIVGRPVFAFLYPQFRIHQDTMVHFNYLVNVEGGVLQTAGTFGDHFRQVSAALAAGVSRDERNRRFLEAFIRPDGLAVPATPRFASAVEALAADHPEPPSDPRPWYGTMLAPMARLLAASGDRGVTGWLMAHQIDTDRARHDRNMRALKRRVRRERAWRKRRKRWMHLARVAADRLRDPKKLKRTLGFSREG